MFDGLTHLHIHLIFISFFYIDYQSKNNDDHILEYTSCINDNVSFWKAK